MKINSPPGKWHYVGKGLSPREMQVVCGAGSDPGTTAISRDAASQLLNMAVVKN